MHDTELLVVADNIRSLFNIGSLFRTSDAMGVCEILCVGISGYPHAGAHDSRRPYLREKQHNAIAKTALAGIHVPFRYFAEAESCLDYIRTRSAYLLVVEQHETSVPLTSLPFLPSCVCVVFGNELHGVSEFFLRHADCIVHIPMLGVGVSLNVCVSAGIVLHFIRYLR